MRSHCGFVLYQSVISPELQKAGVAFAQALIDKLSICGLAKTAEGVAIWIAVRSRFPSVHFPEGVWPTNDPLDRQALKQLMSILTELDIHTDDQDTSDDPLTSKGSWDSTVPFAWQVVIRELASEPHVRNGDYPKSQHRVSFERFWLACVDSKPSHNSCSKI